MFSSLANRVATFMGSKDMLASVGRQSGIVFSIQLAAIAVVYSMHVLLARWMGVGAYGSYAHVLAIANSLAVVAGLGLPLTTVRLVAEFRALSQWAGLKGIVRASQGLTVAAGVVAAAVGAGVLWSTGLWVSADEGALRWGLLLVPLIAIGLLQTELFRALHHMVVAYLPVQVLRPSFVIAGVGALFLTRGPPSATDAVLVTAAAWGFLILFNSVWLPSRLGPEVRGAAASYELKTWLRASVPLLVVTGSNSIWKQIDVVMVGAFLPSDQVGIYNAAARTATFVSFFIAGAAAAAGPRFSSLHAEGKRDELQRLTSAVASWTFWPTLVATILLASLAPWVLALFGPEFVAGGPALIILCVAQLINVSMGAIGHLLVLTGHVDASAKIYALAIVANVAFNAVAIPLFGIVGAALATGLSIVIMSVLLYRLVVVRLGIRPSIVHVLFGRRP